ncbi:Chitinase 1 [Rhizopus stolonifer]|uniref:chitinase n=1 Tax=Rhizopus stolonifer TaxID=4846 RepID=A0A367IT61_RHIST|nr:Chitinase 1 [Rhizopus stolonifer]
MFILCAFVASLLTTLQVQAVYSRNGPNVMYYWGQNSANGATTQGTLASYCQTGQVDAILLSFLHIFNVGGLPQVNFANACEGTYFPNSQLLFCPAIGSDIKTCQDKGVKIILSLGGAAGSYGFSSDDQGQQFAQTLWDLFGGGSSDTRPFGDAIIDGVDLDIEGGTSTGYVTFVSALRSKFSAIKSDFLVGAAPQCPFPDAILGAVINTANLDYVNVQFYNNYCSALGSSFNFDSWDNWAKTQSPNRNVKVYLTLPGSPTAAGSGYVPMSTLTTLIPSVARYSSYGGVSIWDASQAWNNNGFNSQLYTLVHGNIPAPPALTSSSMSNPSTSSSLTSLSTLSSSVPHSTSSSPVPSQSTAPSTPGSCNTGQPCSTLGQYVCTSNGAYAVCDHNIWVTIPCPSGTVCIPTMDGSSIYCGYGTASNTCPSSAFGVSRLAMKGIPAPYDMPKIDTQLAVTSFKQNKFDAVVNARRTTLAPFNQTMLIELTAPRNVRFRQCDLGKVQQRGQRVSIRVNSKHEQNMALVVKLKGSVSSGVFIAPSSFNFN